ncbi:MAG: aminotransferase class IV, partial [Saprospiraceae bacterium]
IKDGEVWTSTGQYCMQGITRGNIIRVCKENNIPVFEKNFSLFDVYGADEAFVTGTFGGVTPVTKIDGRTIGNGEYGDLSRKLSNLYEGLIESEVHRISIDKKSN